VPGGGSKYQTLRPDPGVWFAPWGLVAAVDLVSDRVLETVRASVQAALPRESGASGEFRLGVGRVAGARPWFRVLTACQSDGHAE
jgi:hypothetical protein